MTSQIEEIGIRIRADGVVELTNGTRLTADAVDQLAQRLDNARKPMDALGTSGAHTATSLGGLPAQVGRLVTALATGDTALAGSALAHSQLQAGLLALPPAAGLAAGALLPVALAAGALGLAYAQGSREQDQLQRSLVATGNAAGTTLGELVAMAQGVDAVVATQARANDVLAALAATSVVAGQDLHKFTEIALQAERSTGQAAEDIVKQLAELGRAPVQASVKLNSATHYLTAALYEQIRALQEQGRQTEAASLAQNAWADATRTRSAELEARLGLLERGWRGVKEAAKDAWDAMLNVGRPATLEEQLAAAQKRLAEAPEPRRGTNPLAGQQRRDALRQNIEDLRLQIYLQREAAAADSAAADATRRHIDEREKRQPRAARPARDEPERGWSAYRSWGDAGRAEVAWADDQARQAEAERAKAIERTAQLAARQADALEREAATLANHTAEIGLNEGAITARRQALLDEQIAQVAAQLAVVEGADAYDQHTQALQRQLAALGRLKALQQEAADKTMVEAIRKDRSRLEQQEADDNRRRTERLSDSIEEGILNGYRAGRSASDIFLAELKAQFARTVLRPIISPVAQGISDALGALARGLGLAGQGAGAAGSAAGFMPDANTMAGLWHSGGVPAADSAAATRALPASTWAAAPRFHTGIGPDEVPAVLQRKEGVFTEGQMKALAPVAALERAGGTHIHFSPNYNIEARTDGAQVLALVQAASRQAQAELLDMMDRRMA